MLDGLLGRSGFYSKCKSLLKQTRTRIEVVRRKRNATQKFLRTDIADLISNGLESNAFARADGLISELILSSCYDFIDQVCEIILKHLPVLQKLRECPEDCREAVASLMFAAARFSDLPELRELRDLLQGKYGGSLECFVNPKLVDNITPKPVSMEKKIQLLHDIALEFSIRWDSRGFQERMSNAGAEKKQWPSPGTVLAGKNKVATHPAEDTVQRTAKDEALMKKRNDATYEKKERKVDGRHQTKTGWDSVRSRTADLKHNVHRKPEATDISKSPYREELTEKQEKHDLSHQKGVHKEEARDFQKNTVKEAVQIASSSRGRRLESVDSQHRRRQNLLPEKDFPCTLPPPKPELRTHINGMTARSPVKDEVAGVIHAKSMRTREDDVTDGIKSNFRGGIPPPYSKPSRARHGTDVDGHATENDTLTFKPASNGNRAANLPTKADSPDHQSGASAPENEDGPGRFTEIYYKDEDPVESTPRRRSHRRKHSRSSSSVQEDKVNGEERVVRRVSTSRRRHESRKGLQILVADDEPHHKKDDEEKLIDKLLLHYSRKSTSADPVQSRRKTKSEAKEQKAVDGAEEEDSTPTTSRSFSLPSRHVTEPKPEKVFTRAASFQLDTPAKHVHPKLPDYDDLASRFAALRGSKG